MPAPKNLFITDFDGTMARRDFYDLAHLHLIPKGCPNYWQQHLEGRLTHFEALSAYLISIEKTEPQIDAVLAMMEFDRHAGAEIEKLRGSGWGLSIASAGCEWYIQKILTTHGVSVDIHSNKGELAKPHGIRMIQPKGSPYHCPANGINKLKIVETAKKSYARVAYAGDGMTDLPALLAVAPADRFARGWLADEMRRLNEPFTLFDRWSEIPRQLLR